MNDHSDLKEKIGEVKRRLPLPELMTKLGLGEHAKKEAHCPFHRPDKHPSFSVFQKTDGTWWHKCFVGCSEGDEIRFLSKRKGVGLTRAMNLYLEMAGFPPSRARKSHEYPKSREFPQSPKSLECPMSPKSLECPMSPKSLECPMSPVSPVSNGQELEKELKDLAVGNACKRAGDRAERKRFKLARDLRALEKTIGRELIPVEVRQACDEWERASVASLDWGDDDHFASLLAELTKVRVPTGEGDTINKALENVSKLSDSDLPVIPGYADAPKSCRGLAALHREISHLCGGNTYFLSYRDAAKVCEGLSQQKAHTITGALVRLGVLKIVSKGKAGLNSRKAAEFGYLLPHDECPGDEDDEISV
jgi:hypothetical protein